MQTNDVKDEIEIVDFNHVVPTYNEYELYPMLVVSGIDLSQTVTLDYVTNSTYHE